MPSVNVFDDYVAGAIGGLISLYHNHAQTFLRAKAECFARLCHRLGVRLSVRPSITLVSCIKTVQARITKSSLGLPQGL